MKAMVKEIEMRSEELGDGELSSIYFGGGTPSILSSEELGLIIDAIHANFKINKSAEITLEANPDDITADKLRVWKNKGINRLSIGIQSFRNEDLVLMNRAHNASEAIQCVDLAREAGFKSISIDLIYGIPGLSDAAWTENVKKALSLNVEHISSYCLTIEKKTAFDHFIRKGEMEAPDDKSAASHYSILCDLLLRGGYRHYEVSNFCKPGDEAVHNSSYWTGKPYLGIGPSAHSFDGESRSWNVSNNSVYIKNIRAGESVSESEILSLENRFNEYIMTSIRTAFGVDFKVVKERFGIDLESREAKKLNEWKLKSWIALSTDGFQATESGYLWTDFMAGELFLEA